MTTDNPQAKIEASNTLYHLSHLGSIEVRGADAAKFLQGQLTCNINDLSAEKSSIAAFCNPKGRVISTLLVVKSAEGFILILPRSLLAMVLKKLQMYVLRAAVTLSDRNFTLIGLTCPISNTGLTLPNDNFAVTQNPVIIVKLPSTLPRFLLIADTQAATKLVQADFSVGNLDEWRYQDISAGLPWFDAEQSEQFIPQMLNIDQLGGISFNKGCYTGQEIIARTHYLGKTKRSLFLAECNQSLPDDCELAIVDAESLQSLGDIIAMQSYAGSTRLLVVLQNVDGAAKNLILANAEQTTVTLIPYQ